MGLDMYLHARIPAPAGSDLAAVIERHATDEHRRSLKDHGGAYVSGWSFSATSQPEALYTELVAATGVAATPDSPHLQISTVEDGYVVEPCVHYWRKVNAVHAWFVAETQGGVDECQPSDPFGRDKLQELIMACTAVATTPEMAGAALPTQAGFFFGSTEYDEYYLEDIEDTRKDLTEMLSNLPESVDSFYYQSSW